MNANNCKTIVNFHKRSVDFAKGTSKEPERILNTCVVFIYYIKLNELNSMFNSLYHHPGSNDLFIRLCDHIKYIIII